ncbi:MAG: acyltransferase family protein [Bacteroidaceae bacterium]|nr:acyltransferase family protein [Bacteroidaceae bacterium]
MRRDYIDNIRWMTVLLVLVYHVFYMFNAEGVFGGVGSFAPVQYQDVICNATYPWFMLLLFVVAGASSRYSLEKRTHKEFIRSRTLKLLVPSTLGLFVFHWMTGFFNIYIGGGWDTIPAFVRYPVMAFSGIGPLWFIQDLWVFSLLLVLIRLIDRKDRFYNLCGKIGTLSPITIAVCLLAMGALVLLAGQPVLQTSIEHPANGLFNLHRPVFYLVGFLIGYYVFSHDSVIEGLQKEAVALLLISLTMCILFVIRTFDKDYTAPEVLKSRLFCLFAWFAVVAVFACAKAWCNGKSIFGEYMTRSSFGIYILHYLPCVAVAWTLKTMTSLPVWSIYVLTLVATFLVSFALWETLRRIPFIRFCVLGIKKR